MRRSLALTLAATVALAAWSLRWPPAPRVVAAVTLPALADAQQLASTPSTVPSVAATLSPTWPVVELAPAAGDPFTVAAPTPAVSTLTPPPGPPPLPEAAPAPTAPPLAHRFFGRIVGPDGQLITLLTRTGEPVAVSEGVSLDDGYVVESVGAEAVRLVYPPLGTVVELPLPALPSEVR
jgi:hypothetical protein